MILALLSFGSAHAAVTCGDGRVYATLTDAANDADCSVITMSAGAYWDDVRFDRSVTIVGAGRDETVLFCVEGPCIDANRGTVVLASMSVASTGVAVSARAGRLELFDFRISPLGHRGGELKLRDASATLINVEMEIANTPAIDAVSRFGNDLDFERVHFMGVSPRAGTRGVMYTSNYGVSCADCAFHPQRADAVSELLWGEDGMYAPATERSSSHPYPQMFCPQANDEASAVCDAQCGGESVALCRMTFELMSESCVPRAVCVPDGEVPDHRGVQLVRR